MIAASRVRFRSKGFGQQGIVVVRRLFCEKALCYSHRLRSSQLIRKHGVQAVHVRGPEKNKAPRG